MHDDQRGAQLRGAIREIRDGDTFDAADLAAGLVRLIKPAPRPTPPAEAQHEPWLRDAALPPGHPLISWLRSRRHGTE
jgi:hypothetical protein